jgi:peroxin-10
MFTRRLFPGEQRPGYELLGLLLLLQIATQSYISLTSIDTDSDPTTTLIQDIISPPHKFETKKATPAGPETTELSTPSVSSNSSLDITQGAILDLADDHILPYIPTGSRRCPLCLDPMKDPTAAECGHLFCWTCILRWTGEVVGQGECPICRARCGREGLLRLSG